MTLDIQLFKDLLNLFDRYDKESYSKGPVPPTYTSDILGQKFGLEINENPSSKKEMLNSAEYYLSSIVNTRHPQFFNQLFSTTSNMSQVGDWIASLTNITMATYEMAPLATLIETYLIKKMSGMVGFEQGDGIFTSGGSQSNLVAVLCARHRAVADIKKKGILGSVSKSLVLYVSEQSHYSFISAANILGIGSDNVVRIASNDKGELDVVELEKEIKKSIYNNKHPFLAVATAGTTVLGAYDPIEAMSQLTSKYSMWLHIDGSFGGSILLSQRHKTLLSGSQLADSMTWNPHKLMGVPLPCSAILTKENSILFEACSTSCNDYLFHETEEEDLGLKSLHCGRRADAIKLWFSWKHIGDSGYESRLDHLFDLAAHAEFIVNKDPDLKLLSNRQSLTIFFEIKNKDTIELRQALIEKNKSFVNYAKIKGQVGIRLIISNWELKHSDIDVFFKNLKDCI